MRKMLRSGIAVVVALVAPAAHAQSIAGPVPRAAVSWDAVAMGRLIGSARQARLLGDLMVAERLCHEAFQSVDDSALAAYDAYVDRLHAEHRSEAAAVREQSARFHVLKSEQGRGNQPTSTYLGFAPADGLKTYADLLATLQQPEEAQRMRSLALAYQQVQQAHFQRPMMFRQGQDPRGSC